MRSIRFHSVLAAAGILLIAALPAQASREGFGMTKRAAKVTRVNPPRVVLPGTKISVSVSSQNAADKEFALRLQTLIMSELIGNDQRLAADSRRPDVAVEVTILSHQSGETWETRSLLGAQGEGKGKSVLQLVPVQAQYKVVTHTFSATYKAISVATGRNLDADTLQYQYNEAFRQGNGAPDGAALLDNSIHRAARQIAGRLTATREQIGVLLPKGSLEEIGNFAEASLWNKYLEALEALPAKPGSADDSFRQYALGVAYEALGYEAESPETTLKYLEQASSYYNSALETNPGEKLFALPYDSLFGAKNAESPVERVQSALAAYQTLQQFKQTAEESQVASQSGSPAGGKSLDGQEPAAEVLNNMAVIRMVKSGLAEDIILTAIDSAPKRSFDLSPTGLIELSEANVGKQIIQRMQQIGLKPPARPAVRKKSN